MKRFLVFIICMLLVTLALPVCAEDTFTVTLSAESEVELDNQGKITATVLGGKNTQYVSLLVDGKEVETQKNGLEGEYTFDYVFDAIGTHKVSVIAVDSEKIITSETENVIVTKTNIENKKEIDFSNYTGKEKYPDEIEGIKVFGAANNASKGESIGLYPSNNPDGSLPLPEERAVKITLSEQSLKYWGGSIFLRYEKASTDAVNVKMDFMIDNTKYKFKTLVRGTDSAGKRQEYDMFIIEDGKIKAGSQQIDVAANEWYSMEYSMQPGKSTHRLKITKDGAIIAEYLGEIGVQVSKFESVGFFSCGIGTVASCVLDNFEFYTSTMAPIIGGVSEISGGAAGDCIPYTSDGIYVNTDDFSTITADDVTLENEINAAELREVTFDADKGELLIIPKQELEPSDRYKIRIGKNAVLKNGRTLDCISEYVFSTTSAPLDLVEGSFKDLNGNVTFAAELKDDEGHTHMKLLLLAFKNGVFQSIRVKNIEDLANATISGQYESDTQLKAMVVDDSFIPISNKVYTYIVK